eukprot:728307-Pyramimonas_sp.AAC.2
MKVATEVHMGQRHFPPGPMDAARSAPTTHALWNMPSHPMVHRRISLPRTHAQRKAYRTVYRNESEDRINLRA